METTRVVKRKERNMNLCIWCSNQFRDVCVRECQRQCHYQYLEPEEIESWETPPKLPSFRELLALPAEERLAIIYLVLYYHTKDT